MKLQKNKNFIFGLSLLLALCIPSQAYSAQRILLYKGIFGRPITIEELELFANKGIKKGFLKTIIKNEEEETVQSLLKEKYKAPIELTSKLLYSEIGEVILKRISIIIHPHKIHDESTSILAIKAGTIEALVSGKDYITLIGFLKAYPSEVIAIDVTELGKVVDKVESMKELVKFFSDSPLEKLKSEPS